MSLLETVIAIAVMAIVGVTLFSTIAYTYRANRLTNERAHALNGARRGLERLVRDIREANDGIDGSASVILIDPYQFQFYADADKDSYVEKVDYKIENGDLIRETTDPVSSNPPTYVGGVVTTDFVIGGVSNETSSTPLFHFFDGSGNEITNFSNTGAVRYVTIELEFTVGTDAADVVKLNTAAALRNLNDSY